MADEQQRARATEALAIEYERDGDAEMAAALRSGRTSLFEKPVGRAMLAFAAEQPAPDVREREIADAWLAFKQGFLAGHGAWPSQSIEAMQRLNKLLPTSCTPPPGAALSAAPGEDKLREALKPFADFADPRRFVPAEMTITLGSGMSKRQLTMGDCYRARQALTGEDK